MGRVGGLDAPGVTKVSMLMLDAGPPGRCAAGNGTGHVKDHTGMDTGGGGGTGAGRWSNE